MPGRKPAHAAETVASASRGTSRGPRASNRAIPAAVGRASNPTSSTVVPTMVEPSALVRTYPSLELTAWWSGVAVVDRATIWPRTGRTGIGVRSASDQAEAHAPVAEGNPNHTIALREQPIDGCAFQNDRAQIGRGARQCLGKDTWHDLVMVLIEQGRPHVGVQRWFDIHCGGAIEPADRHSLIELPGAVRSELRLFGLIERDVKQRGPTIPDVDPGAFQQFGRQRGKEAGTLGPERGVCG